MCLRHYSYSLQGHLLTLALYAGQGWIDVTYLSQDGKLRLTRGNKGALLQLAPSQYHNIVQYDDDYFGPDGPLIA